MTHDAEDIRHLADLAVKEYDSLRKEIEARADATRTYGWPVILLAFGAIAGFKPELIDINSALTFIPTVAITIAALDANARHEKVKFSRSIALVEDRVFLLSGAPVLCHETVELRRERRRAGRQVAKAVAFSLVYAAVESYVSLALLPRRGTVNAARTLLFFGVVVTPLILYVYSLVMVYNLYKAPLRTCLLAHIEAHKPLPPDGARLIYDTDKDLPPPENPTVITKVPENADQSSFAARPSAD